MQRRKFLKVGLTGVAVLSLAPLAGCGGSGNGGSNGNNGGNSGGGSGGGGDADVVVNLSAEEALFTMVDGSLVYHWAFRDRGPGGPGLPQLPGPVLNAVAGQTIEVNLANNLHEEHGFAVHGVPETELRVPAGETRSLTFTAPAAGTYLYLDPLNAPVNRVLGLHGAMVVLPAAGPTPYGDPTPAVRQLFDDLGTTPHFPRHALAPAGWQRERSRIWLMHQVDPAFNARAQNGEFISAAELAEHFQPSYFLINGRSGAFVSHDPASNLLGRIGEPMLVRTLNAGLYTHSNHLHANHFYVTAVNGRVRDNVPFIDTYAVFPLDTVDWLVPFIRPPDIPGDERIPLRDLIPNELALTIDGPNGSPGVPQSPLVYPMHCHNEPSQTAAGGNYPQGAVVHIEFLGDLDGVDFPHD